MSSIRMCDDSRNAPQLELRTCPMCERTSPARGRGVYCGPTCRQRAFRLRHRQTSRPTPRKLTVQLRHEQRLVAQTVYECTSCLRFVSSKSTSTKTKRDEEPERRVLL